MGDKYARRARRCTDRVHRNLRRQADRLLRQARWSEPGSVTLEHTAKFWVFLIGIFSGARLGEIIQLHVDDIKVENEIPYFDFSETVPGNPYPNRSRPAQAGAEPLFIPSCWNLDF